MASSSTESQKVDEAITLRRNTSLGREKSKLRNAMLSHMNSSLNRKQNYYDYDDNFESDMPLNVKSSNGPGVLTKLDYLAVKTSTNVLKLGDPREFKNMGLNKAIRFQKDIKICIVITFYNEPAEEVLLTIRGICENLKSLNEKFRNPNYWQHVCIVLIGDGRAKLHDSTASLLEQAGVYDSSLLNLEQDTGMHIFQSLPVFSDDPWIDSTFPPLQTILMIKEHNQGKISSHWWFFEATCTAIDPQYCVMFDVGTKPLRNTLFSIYRCFERNNQITGISGELFCREVGNWNPIVAAQQIDYKFGTIIDRATESLTGYLSVLPGCLSAYRWEDLQGGPLRVYFETLENPSRKWTVFESLVNLADDRLLCLELFCLPNKNATLHYLKDAVAESDVCMSLSELMKQRRRWINSAIATLFHVMGQYGRIWKHEKHTFLRKISALMIMIYYFLISFFTFISVGVYALFLDINMVKILNDDTVGILIFRIVFYFSILFQIVTGCISLDVKKYENVFYILAAYYAIIFVPVTVHATWLTINGSLLIGFGNLLFVGLMFNFGVYFLMGLFHGHFLTMVVSFPQYLLSLPIFSIIIPVYCITNLHDLTWGTKSADQMSQAELERKAEFVSFRNKAFFAWCIANLAVLAAGLYTFYTSTDIYSAVGGFFMLFLYITLFWVGVRFIAACIVVLLHSYHKRIEKIQHEKELARTGYFLHRNISQKSLALAAKSSILQATLSMLSILIKWPTFIALLNVFVFSPAYCVLSVFILIGCVIIGIPLIIIGIFVASLRLCFGEYADCAGSLISDSVACLAILTRYLGTIEFSYNSFDGKLARWMGVEQRKKTGAGRLYTNPALKLPEQMEYYSLFRTIFSDEFTWRSALYIVYIKPLTTFTALLTALLAVEIPISLLLKNYASSVTIPFLYNPEFLYNIPNPFSTILGATSLIPLLWLVWYLDKNMRLITSWSLASHVMNLDPKETSFE